MDQSQQFEGTTIGQPSEGNSEVTSAIGSHRFIRVRSLRYGENGCWCDPSGRYAVDGEAQSAPFFFHVKRVDKAKTFIKLQCKPYKRTRCPVAPRIKEDGEILHLTGYHNHPPDEEGCGMEYRDARTDFIRDIRENPRKKPIDAIMERRRKLTLEPASRIVPAAHARTLRRHATKVRPPRVTSLRQLHDVLLLKDYVGFNVTQFGQRLLSFFSPEHNAVVLTTPRLLALATEARLIHADATYKIAPRKICRQVFTLHANWGGYVGLIACAFMKTADAAAYRWVLQSLRSACPDFNIPAYMGDWDCAMRKAVKDEFPEAELYGCLFHFSQSLVRRASERIVGLAHSIRVPGEILSNFLAFTALPLLPEALIEPAFAILAARALPVHKGFVPFVDYVWSQWLCKTGAANLTVYRMRTRTNNDVESNNATFLRRTGAHGPVWSLVSTIAEFAVDIEVNKRIHARGVEAILSTPKKATKRNSTNLHAYWALLEAGTMSPIEFIDRVKYKIGKLNHRLTLALALKRGCHGCEQPADPSLRTWLEDGSVQHLEQKPSLKPTAHVPDDELSNCDTSSDIDPIGSDYAFSSSSDEWVHAANARTVDEETSYASAMPQVLSDHTYAKQDKSLICLTVLEGKPSNPQIPPITGGMRDAIGEALAKPRTSLLAGGSDIMQNVRGCDLHTLVDSSWLNDVIMNAYLSLIVHRSQTHAELPKTYAFSTFFLPIYERDGYRGISRWTKQVDVFAYDILLFPVHRRQHWCLMVVDMRDKVIKQMDSLGGTLDETTAAELLHYLEQEMVARKNEAFDARDWLIVNLKTPQQENGHDCGIFALKFADYAARDALINFTQIDAQYFRERIMFEILRTSIFPTGYD